MCLFKEFNNWSVRLPDLFAFSQEKFFLYLLFVLRRRSLRLIRPPAGRQSSQRLAFFDLSVFLALFVRPVINVRTGVNIFYSCKAHRLFVFLSHSPPLRAPFLIAHTPNAPLPSSQNQNNSSGFIFRNSSQGSDLLSIRYILSGLNFCLKAFIPFLFFA